MLSEQKQKTRNNLEVVFKQVTVEIQIVTKKNAIGFYVLTWKQAPGPTEKGKQPCEGGCRMCFHLC